MSCEFSGNAIDKLVGCHSNKLAEEPVALTSKEFFQLQWAVAAYFAEPMHCG